MNDLTFDILKIVVSICAALVAFYLVPYIKNKLNNEKYAQLVAFVEVAVHAAEQTVKGTGMGTVKKGEVISVINNWMAEKGFTITQEQLLELIEAAVYNMNNRA